MSFFTPSDLPDLLTAAGIDFVVVHEGLGTTCEGCAPIDSAAA